ncbi:MAG: dimethylhistidine N-methyltransferase [Alphaproteobacteria bacterium BRH_c36]|nr:MAG: dimethylhistidine N-methyltransferase [Alphaproteobacteria bacterium BRH_c36]
MSKPAVKRAVAETSEGSHPADLEFARALLNGLRAPEKSIPCRFLYDTRGSELFEEITELPEYYPTRTETAILEACASDIRHATRAGSLLVEFGSGSSTKTEILLSALDRLSGYVAIDISPSALDEAAKRLSKRFRDLQIFPIVGDFSRPLELPAQFDAVPRIGFFPGSTIGNLVPEAAVDLLANMGRILGAGSRLIVGADLRKDRDILLAAYNDAQGVTAAFNLNILGRANRDLRAKFDLAQFEHLATYDDDKGRIDMHIVSRVDQIVTVLGHDIAFQNGERIHTEHSHKYDIAGFQNLAICAGWTPQRVWTDSAKLFSIHELHRPVGED